MGVVARVTLVAALLATSACSSSSRTALDTMKLVGNRWKSPVLVEKLEGVTHAVMQVEGPGYRGAMVMGLVDGDRQAWYGGQGELMLLRHGLVVGTHGMAGANVDEVRIEGDNPFLHLAALGDRQATVTRRYDWRDGYRYGVVVEGHLQRRGSERVEILGNARELVHYEESLSGPGVRGSNHYWADPNTGFVWKSRQLVAPGTWVELVHLKLQGNPG